VERNKVGSREAEKKRGGGVCAGQPLGGRVREGFSRLGKERQEIETK